MGSSMSRLIAGFVAGALAVLIFHQGMYVLMQQMGLPLRGAPFNMSPNQAAFGLPVLVNQMFWGGLWGIAFAWVIDALPGPNWLRGLIFGCLGPILLGGFILVAYFKQQPYFGGAFDKGGFNPMAWRNTFLLNGVGFGIGLGLIYPLLAGALGGRSVKRA
jgi:hypothetical protein